MSSSLLALATRIYIQCMLIYAVFASHRSPGETTPTRLEIEAGGSDNVTCHMNLQMFSGQDSSSLYFVQEDSGVSVPSTDIVILNESTIVYMLRNASEQNRNYVCKSGSNGIGVTHVSVGTKPPDVNDYRCRGFDYTYMVCNFTIPNNMILTQYNLTYTAQSPNYLQICQLEIQNSHGICNLTLDKSNYRPNYEFYNFTLTGHNVLGTNRQNFWINHYESVIPPKPIYEFEQITNSSVVLSWTMIKYSYYNLNRLQYEIRVRPDGFDWMNHSNYEIRNNKSEYKLKLRNLPYAYFWYTVSVRMKVKSARSDDSMWSEPYVHTFQTKPCPPENPPTTDVGSFYIDSTETRVRLYWQQLPVYRENGADFHYVVTEIKRDGVVIDLKPVDIDRTSAIISWDKHHQYEFTIKSRNAEGDSPQSSQIIVPRMSKTIDVKSPKWIRNVYHAPNRTYTLSWSQPDDITGLLDYTVFWCQSKRALPNECKDTIRFKRISKDTVKFTTEPQEHEHTLNLAVSANYADFNTGMHWTMCTADVSSDLVKLEPEVTAISARIIEVQWSPDRVCTSLLEGYNLIYCRVEKSLNATNDPMKCLAPNTSVNIEKTAKKYLITKLKPFSIYKIEMYMYSKLKVGKISDVQYVQTKEEAPTPPRSLKYRNITSNSASISWMPPIEVNGNLQYYTVVQNNEHHMVNCSALLSGNGTLCGNDTGKEINYKLENLSSYTNYKVYITAHTIDASYPSNDVHFKTLIGIPSNPRHMVPSENNHNVMQWQKPEVPSGRVEFYEVSVTVWYKDQIKRQRISVVESTSCTMSTPVCLDMDYKYTLQVRAVNVAGRNNEVDHEVFAANGTDENADTTYYEGNDDLKCVGVAMEEAKTAGSPARYRNTNNYVLYRSVWEKGPIYACAATSKLSRVTTVALLVVISSLGVMAAFYFARNKYNKMADIGCQLPGELRAMHNHISIRGVDNNMIEKDDEPLHRSKECIYSNENRRLLASACNGNDSGYLGMTGALGGLSTYSIGHSSGYVGSDDHAENYAQQNQNTTKLQPTAEVDDAYMVMEILKPQAEIATECDQKDRSAIDNGYVKPNETDVNMPVKPLPPNLPIIPSDNGYITRNKIFNWQPPLSSNTNQNFDDLLVGSSGYVAPHMLQKPIIQPTTFNGYTTLDALGKPPANTPAQPETSPLHTFGGGFPPISGYVTQKELSALGQQRMS